MPTFDENGNPVYAEWTPEMKNSLHSNLKFIDPDKQGVDRSKLRLFLPKVGWNDIQKGIDGLIADGRLESVMVSHGNAVVESFVWKEA